MQIEQTTKTLESAGLGESGNFSIKTTAAAFQMLSSGLYSNKIRAVIRELSSNAIDAHTMVQRKDVPIEVKMPNSLDSQFYVKDSGPGLSHENIMQMYTTYFDSSKQASNDFIGGFGVGSKSPFAYTDAFTVESRHDGQRHLYSAFIGEDNTPKIAQIGTFPMDPGEDTGLTVSMPVRPNDFHQFEREACDLFRWFDTKPTLLGSSRSLEPPEKTEVAPGLSWRASAAYSESILVRMGQVVYSIDKFASFATPEVNDCMRALTRFRPLLDVPIGNISVAASREEIAYDKTTKDYLSKRIPEIYNFAMDDVVRQLQAIDLKDHEGRSKGFEFLQNYGLSNFYSEKKVDELIENKRAVPELNQILRSKKISADQFLPILKGMESPTEQQAKVIEAAMPYLKDKIENWCSGTHKRWDPTQKYLKVKIVEIDLPLNSVYAEKARRAWASVNQNHATRTIAIRQIPGTDVQEYSKVRDELLKNWGLKSSDITPLSKALSPEDLTRFQKTQGTQNVPAKTLFGSRPSMCTSDMKSFYYVEMEANGQRVKTPEGWSAQALQKLVSTFQENATLARKFCQDIGADPGTLARTYAIEAVDAEKMKTFPGALNFLDVLGSAMEQPEFLQKWTSLPIRREHKYISYTKLFQSSMYRNKTVHENTQTALSNTQLGQAVDWLLKIPEWEYSDRERRPDDVQYVFLGELLSKTLKDKPPLPSKFVDSDVLSQTIHAYYPMLAGTMRENAYNMVEDIAQEIVRYVSWKDTLAVEPLLKGVTSLPSPQTLEASENTLQSPTF